MDAANEILNDWLRDAHAMEKQALTMLQGQVDRLDNYPELRVRISQHVQETERHINLVNECLERRGASNSTLKDIGAKLTATGQSLSGIFVSDEVIKGSLASYTFEHMEIASYKMLVTAAEYVGDQDTKRVCEQILKDEVAMAKWLEDNTSGVTQLFLQRALEERETAKR